MTKQQLKEQKMTRQELFRRYLLLLIGLFLAAVGIAFTRHGELGVSPISSVANVFSYKFTFFSLGTWLFLWNCTMIVGQILILRRKFQLIQLLQIPLSLVFGWFTDFGLWCVAPIPVHLYPVRILMVLIGTAILGLGVAVSVTANVIMNSGEALVKAIADTFRRNFGNVKIAFDVSCVASAILLSLLFFHGRIVGTREGTIIAALLTGVAVKFFMKQLSDPLTSLCRPADKQESRN